MQTTSATTLAAANSRARQALGNMETADMLYCTVETSRVAEEDTKKAALGAIRAIVEKEIRAIYGQSS